MNRRNLLRVGILLAMTGIATVGAAEDRVDVIVSDRTHSYERLSSEMWSMRTVRGPAELRLLFRAAIEPASDGTIDFALDLRINGAPIETLSFSDVGRSRAVVFRDGRLGVPAQLRDRILDLGPGFHNIEIRSQSEIDAIYFRHQLEKKKRRVRRWVSLEPTGGEQRVELEVREQFVTYFRNRPNRPFRVEVIGPTQLRIFSRLENRPDMRGRIHYRLQVRKNSEVINTFRLSSRRSEIATYQAQDALVPGQAREIVIPVPKGLHRFEIESIDRDKSVLLARFMLPFKDLELEVPNDALP